MNRESGISRGRTNDEAVVLTLRKRYSTVRRRTKSVGPGTAPGLEAVAISENGIDEDSTRNPWSDLRDADVNGAGGDALGPQRTLAHRLSFDDATGIITLPEDSHWLMEDVDSDSEEDYGSTAGVLNENTGELPPVAEGPLVDSSPTTALVSPPKQRHGTYYHHPEKRRQTIPGAFPRQ